MNQKITISIFVALTFLSFSYKNKKFKTPENFVFIPSGTSQISEKDNYSCYAFYMLEHEVTNFEYRKFLEKLKGEGKTEEYKIAYPDSTKWLACGGYMQPMAQYYFSHPAYDNYPVVNISKEGAELFCIYLTEHYRNIYGENAINDFRLPTKEEWIYAAKGGHIQSPYPWGGPELRNSKGCYLANFKTIGDQNITSSKDGLVVVVDSLRSNSQMTDGGFLMVSANSYSPNDYGLYNMSGNVAELVSDSDLSMGGHWNSVGYDIRVVSEEKFEGANPFVGFRPVMSFIKKEK